MDEERFTFTVPNEHGEEVECELLFSFKSDVTGKSYVLYTDYSLDEYDNTKVYASSFDPDSDGGLCPVETDEEWEMIAEILDQKQNEAMSNFTEEE